MFKEIFEKLRRWLRPAPSPKNSEGRQELLKKFLSEFGTTVIPGTKKTLNRAGVTWERNRNGQWRLISPFVSPEMRQEFPFLWFRRQHSPVAQPRETPNQRKSHPPQTKPPRPRSASKH